MYYIENIVYYVLYCKYCRVKYIVNKNRSYNKKYNYSIV